MALHRLADFCVVSSLHDGMNLVAKEYAASRTDEDGVLLLSRFTGSAALELSDALLFNPFDVNKLTECMRQALEMTGEEQEEADAAPAHRRAGQQRLSMGGEDPLRAVEGRRCGFAVKKRTPEPTHAGGSSRSSQ